MLLTVSPFVGVELFGEGDGDDFHDAPNDVKDGGEDHADEQ
jgi:hypothetical protein